ncbi:hypothetical protein CBOM_04930 [Ceraceosorus bombacis]|uniref:Uncharacterized protein n=1 Tax=Ceraceosorus bombacis TaxID=401625 RepID=A0A0P1BHP1_9BASI|nr:hypothetical protein CBOM_04930 [Ceraceosorus bombacis]
MALRPRLRSVLLAAHTSRGAWRSTYSLDSSFSIDRTTRRHASSRADEELDEHSYDDHEDNVYGLHELEEKSQIDVASFFAQESHRASSSKVGRPRQGARSDPTVFQKAAYGEEVSDSASTPNAWPQEIDAGSLKKDAPDLNELDEVIMRVKTLHAQRKRAATRVGKVKSKAEDQMKLWDACVTSVYSAFNVSQLRAQRTAAFSGSPISATKQEILDQLAGSKSKTLNKRRLVELLIVGRYGITPLVEEPATKVEKDARVSAPVIVHNAEVRVALRDAWLWQLGDPRATVVSNAAARLQQRYVEQQELESPSEESDDFLGPGDSKRKVSVEAGFADLQHNVHGDEDTEPSFVIPIRGRNEEHVRVLKECLQDWVDDMASLQPIDVDLATLLSEEPIDVPPPSPDILFAVRDVAKVFIDYAPSPALKQATNPATDSTSVQLDAKDLLRLRMYTLDEHSAALAQALLRQYVSEASQASSRSLMSYAVSPENVGGIPHDHREHKGALYGMVPSFAQSQPNWTARATAERLSWRVGRHLRSWETDAGHMQISNISHASDESSTEYTLSPWSFLEKQLSTSGQNGQPIFGSVERVYSAEFGVIIFDSPGDSLLSAPMLSTWSLNTLQDQLSSMEPPSFRPSVAPWGTLLLADYKSGRNITRGLSGIGMLVDQKEDHHARLTYRASNGRRLVVKIAHPTPAAHDLAAKDRALEARHGESQYDTERSAPFDPESGDVGREPNHEAPASTAPDFDSNVEGAFKNSSHDDAITAPEPDAAPVAPADTGISAHWADASEADVIAPQHPVDMRIQALQRHSFSQEGVASVRTALEGFLQSWTQLAEEAAVHENSQSGKRQAAVDAVPVPLSGKGMPLAPSQLVVGGDRLKLESAEHIDRLQLYYAGTSEPRAPYDPFGEPADDPAQSQMGVEDDAQQAWKSVMDMLEEMSQQDADARQLESDRNMPKELASVPYRPRIVFESVKRDGDTHSSTRMRLEWSDEPFPPAKANESTATEPATTSTPALPWSTAADHINSILSRKFRTLRGAQT